MTNPFLRLKRRCRIPPEVPQKWSTMSRCPPETPPYQMGCLSQWHLRDVVTSLHHRPKRRWELWIHNVISVLDFFSRVFITHQKRLVVTWQPCSNGDPITHAVLWEVLWCELFTNPPGPWMTVVTSPWTRQKLVTVRKCPGTLTVHPRPRLHPVNTTRGHWFNWRHPSVTVNVRTGDRRSAS